MTITPEFHQLFHRLLRSSLPRLRAQWRPVGSCPELGLRTTTDAHIGRKSGLDSKLGWSDDQKRIADAYKAQLDRANVFPERIVTEVTPLKGFYRAEDYH